ncbi:MAG: hypothetical protein JWP38_3646, partial [Herbaspirillum sp.]|nr:hypothetical protein [Herbaspirillum sp.]
MRKTIIGILVATSLLVSGAAANAEIVAHTPTTFTNFSDSISHEFSAADAGQTFQEFFDLTIPTSSSLFAGVISGSLGITGLDITGLTLQD